jgi:hypothetical protein
MKNAAIASVPLNKSSTNEARQATIGQLVLPPKLLNIQFLGYSISMVRQIGAAAEEHHRHARTWAKVPC